MTPLVLLGLVAVLVGLRSVERHRQQLLHRIGAMWGTAPDRVHNLDALAEGHRARLAREVASLDSRTWADLDLDDVFLAIDRTVSTAGQHALYHRLHAMPVADHREAFETLVMRMATDVPARERAQIALSRLQDPHGYNLWWLARPDAFEARAWYAVFPVLSAVTVGVLLWAALWHALAVTLAGVLVVNLGVRLASVRHVVPLSTALRQVAPVIATGERLQFLAREDTAPIMASLPSDVSRLHRLKTIARWAGGDPLMTSFTWDWLSMMLTELSRAAYEYLNLVLLLDANAVYFGTRDLREHAACLLRVLEAVGDVDTAISIAAWRAGLAEWTRPRFGPPGATSVFANITHPLVEHAVPNTLTLAAGRGVLVTGSNMSGKSTLLRTIGVNAVLAQTINTCVAAHYEAPVFHVRSCIGRADDILTGTSYYLAEVEAVLALVAASHSQAPQLFLFDELFRGTNAVERIAAAEAVLRELLPEQGEGARHVVLVATHDGELVDLLQDTYDAYHFSDRISDEGLRFDYRLQPGRATSRNAIALLNLHGASHALISRALARVEALDRQRAGRAV